MDYAYYLLKYVYWTQLKIIKIMKSKNSFFKKLIVWLRYVF